MPKRNSNFSIYAHLRMLLKAFPMRNEATLRLAIAARIEADEATGEVFGRDPVSARFHLQDVANVPREASLDKAMGQLSKLKLTQGLRQYSRGERKQGGDRIVLNWDQWEEACLCPALSEGQTPDDTTLAKRGATSTLSEGQPPTLSEGQHNKDYGYSNGYSNVDGHANGVPAIPSNPPIVSASESLPLLIPESGAELQLQELEVVKSSEGISWIDPSQLPPTYQQGVWFDRTLGKLSLVNSEKGRAFYRGLRDEPYPIEAIKAGLTAACVKAPSVKARNGGYEALVRTYCGYALEKQTAAQGASRARETAFQRPRQFQP